MKHSLSIRFTSHGDTKMELGSAQKSLLSKLFFCLTFLTWIIQWQYLHIRAL